MRTSAGLGTARVRTRWPVRCARRGRSTAAKRSRTWKVTRDFVTFTLTGPCARAAASSASNASRTSGTQPAKWSSSGTTAHECDMFGETKRCPHTGHVHIRRTLACARLPRQLVRQPEAAEHQLQALGIGVHVDPALELVLALD